MKDNKLDLQNVIKSLSKLKTEDVEVPPYLKTRVLARLKDKQQNIGVLNMWKKLAVMSSSLLVLGVITFFLILPTLKNGFHNATLSQPFVVKIEVNDIKALDVAYAKIDLPEGVSFYSKRFPKLNKIKSLSLSWENAIVNSHLPFVIKGDISGKKILRISFFSKQDQIITTKEFKINFKEKI